jgi:hypothetical protein
MEKQIKHNQIEYNNKINKLEKVLNGEKIKLKKKTEEKEKITHQLKKEKLDLSRAKGLIENYSIYENIQKTMLII